MMSWFVVCLLFVRVLHRFQQLFSHISHTVLRVIVSLYVTNSRRTD